MEHSCPDIRAMQQINTCLIWRCSFYLYNSYNSVYSLKENRRTGLCKYIIIAKPQIFMPQILSNLGHAVISGQHNFLNERT